MTQSKEEFLQDASISHILTPPPLPPLGLGVMQFKLLVSLPYRCYNPNLIKIGPVVLEKKMLMSMHASIVTDDDGRQPIAKTRNEIKYMIFIFKKETNYCLN